MKGTIGHLYGKVRQRKGRIIRADGTAPEDCRTCRVCENCTGVPLKCVPHTIPWPPTPYEVCTPNLWRMCYHGLPAGQTYEKPFSRTYDTGVTNPTGVPGPTYFHYARRVECHKLFVWKGIRYRDNAVHTDDVGKTTDHVLHTNGAGARGFGAEPFLTSYSGGPTGDPLDQEPYWYKTCAIGGWALTTSWFAPTVAELDTHRDEAAMPLADGTYTHLVLLRFTKWKKQPRDGGAIIIPENQGGVQFRRWQLIRTV
jgi:hypothetical protein